MIRLSQRNPSWVSMKIGVSNLTIWRWGCTTTCLSMLSDYFKCFSSPPKIAGNGAWYTADGLIIWAKLNFPNMKFEKRVKGFDKAAIDASIKDPNKAVILEVADGSHWVVATGKTWFGNDYKIADPWDGKDATAIGKYKNISGSAHFIKK